MCFDDFGIWKEIRRICPGDINWGAVGRDSLSYKVVITKKDNLPDMLVLFCVFWDGAAFALVANTPSISSTLKPMLIVLRRTILSPFFILD